MAMRKFRFLFLVLVFAFSGCSDHSATHSVDLDLRTEQLPDMPQPVDGVVPEENEDSEALRLQWVEQLHSCDPNTDWREINRLNTKLMSENRPAQLNARSMNETFANGQLTGVWSERGSNNVSGSMHRCRYIPETDEIYGMGAELVNTIGGRSLWKGNRDGTGWQVLNDGYFLKPDAMEAFVPDNSSDVRVVVIDRKFPQYTDDDGANWTVSTMTPDMGFANLGTRHRLGHLPGDNDTIFYTVRTWDDVSSAYQIWMYRSIDAGASFDRVHVFTETTRKKMDMWVPKTDTTAYVLENSTELHSFDSSSNSSVTCSGLPASRAEYQLTGSTAGNTVTLYALIDGEEIYRSDDQGVNWSFVANAPINAWEVGMTCSPDDSDKLFIGGVNCHFSYDGGLTWEQANHWSEYYANIDLLHADMMSFEFAETLAGESFLMIGNHGGLHVTYDGMQTTENISKTGLTVGQYYDVITHPDQTNLIYLGSQDQGWQWTTDGNDPGVVDFVQQISGDYGQLQLTRDNQSYWTQYPGAWFSYYHDSTNPISSSSSYNVDGQHIPYWIVPTGKFRADPASNSILVAGGALGGGSGSYLIRLDADTSAPHDITASQYNYDFRANSVSEGRISAIDQPVHDEDTIYVTTSDGCFFKTTDGGSTWQKTPGFQGAPTNWIYTSSIYASRLDPDLIWTSGSGYNNPPVYKSTDGGDTFVEMSNGLPNTLVQKIVASPDETMLFAATDAGPFVYIVADDQWYSMLGANTPLSWFTAVEYVEALDVVRFATIGRGVWDFAITPQPVEDPGESGIVTNLTHQWQTISFGQTFTDPVVVMGNTTFNGSDPVTVRVRNVTGTGFEVRIDEWDYLNGFHNSAEDVPFVVMEAGVHTLADGTTIEAGKTVLDEQWKSISYSSAFSTTPVILSQTMSENGPAAVVTRHKNVDTSGFEIRLQEEQAANQIHIDEDVSWIAIQPGSGTNGSYTYEAELTGDTVTHVDHDINYTQSYGATPYVFSALQTFDGADCATMRGRSFDPNGATVFMEEEKSADSEIKHTTEVLGYWIMTSGSIE